MTNTQTNKGNAFIRILGAVILTIGMAIGLAWLFAMAGMVIDEVMNPNDDWAGLAGYIFGGAFGVLAGIITGAILSFRTKLVSKEGAFFVGAAVAAGPVLFLMSGIN